VDYIRTKGTLRDWYSASGPARDFSLTDVELRLMEPHVSVNGKGLAATSNFTGGVTGAAVAFYIPDYGRYILSLVPHPDLGFQKAGEIRGSSLTITIGGDTITLDCNGRIAPGYAAYNVYALHDAAWRPRDSAARNAFLMNSSDGLEKLLHN
jgi:hypothetical protein